MPKGTLKYWFSGLDAPINGAWQDKVSGIRYILYKDSSTTDGETLWDQENRYYNFRGSNGNYAYLSNMNSVIINFGHHWRLEFDLYENSGMSRDRNQFWDFGSVTNASHAIGFGLIAKDENYPSGRMSVNWKMQGNNSNPGLSSYGSPSLIDTTDNFIHYRGYYAMLDGGDGYDRLHLKLNGKRDIVPVQVPQVEYGPTWNRGESFIGRGVIGYSSFVRIRDLKIYVID